MSIELDEWLITFPGVAKGVLVAARVLGLCTRSHVRVCASVRARVDAMHYRRLLYGGRERDKEVTVIGQHLPSQFIAYPVGEKARSLVEQTCVLSSNIILFNYYLLIISS